MSRWQLTLRQAPPLRLDLRGITPAALADLDAAAIARLPLAHGNAWTPLGEWLDVAPLATDTEDLRLSGDLRRVDRIGWQLDAGRLRVDGPAGDHLGGAMRGGTLWADSAGDLAACEMVGGALHIAGDAGDFAASTLPGSMDGMRGGLLHIGGRVGARCADRMRRGTVIVQGDAGDFLASRLVAGTLAVAGRCGAHPAWGMRRGTLLLPGMTGLAAPATFVPDQADTRVFRRLLAQELTRLGAPWAAAALPGLRAWRGDLAVDGRGELLIPE